MSALIQAAPANGNPKLLARTAAILGQIGGMYGDDGRHREMLARFAFAKLEPAMRRLGWNARDGEPANDAVLRNELIGTLGALGHPATLAEANRRFAANDPSVTAGPLRSTILAIVANNADERTWERLRRMARDERSMRPGGTMSGPAMFKLADFAVYVAILAELGTGAMEAVTTSMTINFLLRPPAADLVAEARLLKLGRRLVVAEVALYAVGGAAMVAHATSTYALPPRRVV